VILLESQDELVALLLSWTNRRTVKRIKRIDEILGLVIVDNFLDNEENRNFIND